MIEASVFDPGEALVGRIVLRPNNSMTWRATKYFLGALFAVSFTVAFAFTVQGYWMILPFTALEMSIVAGCFYMIVKRAERQEVIGMSTDRIFVECGRREPERRVEWQRFFTKVLVDPGRHPWYRMRIQLRCRGEAIDVGSFLNTEEKQSLVRALRDLIRIADERHVGH